MFLKIALEAASNQCLIAEALLDKHCEEDQFDVWMLKYDVMATLTLAANCRSTANCSCF